MEPLRSARVTGRGRWRGYGLLSLALVTVLLLGTAVLGHAGAAATGTPPAGATPGTPSAETIAALADLLTRRGHTGEGIDVELVLATPTFFRLTDRWQEAVDYGADRAVVFVAIRHHHGALVAGQPDPFAPILRLDGQQFHVPSQVRLLSDDEHNRTNVIVFGDLPATLLDEDHLLELLLPPAPDGTRPTFRWSTPIELPNVGPVATPDPVTGYVHPESLADAAWLRHHRADPGVKVIALTPADAYQAGHIPGAVNLDATANVRPDQPRYWKSADELRAMYAALGVKPDKTVIPYCAAGVRSAATYFALRLIGYEDVALFTGSWNEWSNHPELPVETGSMPGMDHQHHEEST
jgi:rhodanese-related sulfurtransferase